MNRVRISLFAAALSFLAAGMLPAQVQRGNPNMGEGGRAEFELRRWRSDLVSELRLSDSGAAGTTVQAVEDLGLPTERTWDYHFAIRFSRRLKARGNWFKVRYDGQAIPGEELCIGGLCTPAGSELSTGLELEMVRAGLEFDLVEGDYGFLAVVGEYGRFDLRTEFESAAGSVPPGQERMELPMFGIKGRVYLTPALALTVEGVGMKRESEGVMTDFDVSGTYNMVKNLAISYGYRNSYNRFRPLEDVGDRATVRLRGQYFSVIVRF
jgi:hypothetical protein